MAFLCFFISSNCYSQDLSSDSLLILARKAAFGENTSGNPVLVSFDNGKTWIKSEGGKSQKDYEKAKAYLYRALKKSPGYSDVRIFLGRIYTWTDNIDSARANFDYVVKNDSTYEDVYSAYTDLEYWNDNNKKALSLAETGLKYHPTSIDLLIKKAKVLRAMKKYYDALAATHQALAQDKNNPEAKKLEEGIKEDMAINSITLGYSLVYFDKQFDNPWHLFNFDYGRLTPIGKVIGRVNVANRFGDNGVQFEVDAYPHFSKMFYSYMNIGYSADTNGVFPVWRAGFSLYANLPKSFEAEFGFRYLYFSSPIWIYTGYIGKYYKKWLFSERAWIVPSTYSSTISTSFSLSASYYWAGDADNLIGGVMGFGIAPDDRATAPLINGPAKMSAFKLGIFYKRKLTPMNVLSLGQSWQNTEYFPGARGNQFQFDISWTHRY